ncbi:glutamyl-tRNA(Gln) amidotransferase subunit A, mitochondrial [Drosophila guanche]|uniref:Glutamyl-tRNA(Gln) amidotransferase subunit A, mitochondrial n=1 Tax=Drosophila guanche TaxID=7266 RepID=A0A3B0KBW5_DROGU|nr:glutamyl-tRNA(Gln) amidotransferase subunit A, mitochondrial [Drosophila guanche]SPP82551.1 blast:Glutamyl-tRNA(Gln) amidotransferase subunit A%2C mitochondrial [Drosophila guanche]
MRRHLQWSIKQLTSSYADGQLSPRRVAEQALEDAVNLKTLNAFVRLTPEEARQQALESEQRYQKKQPNSGLDGVTIAIKDNFCTKNVHTTCASRMLQDFVPPYDATVCSRLRQAGAVLLGKTNMDQFAMGAGTVDSIYGPAKNIWSEDLTEDNWRIAGGSSGGSASAVAAGLCFAGIGSDTGGSTRNPASYCGVVGLKPTYGLVSRHGLIPLVNSMDVPGIFARSVSDCVEVLNAVAGPDGKDSTTIKQPFTKIQLSEVDGIDLGTVRIGIPKEYHCNGLSAEVLETWTKVADLLECAGASVQQVSLPNTAASIFVYSILNQCEVASNMARYDGIEYGHRAADERSTEQLYAQSRAEGFNNVVKTRILTGNFLLLRKNYDHYFEKALRVRRLIAEDFSKVFEASSKEDRVDILLTPTTLTEAPLYKDFSSLSNRDQCAMQDFCTQPANMAGIPAVSIPIRLSSAGLPLSLQLMSRSLNEQLLLSVARWIEAQVAFDSLDHRLEQKLSL